MVEGDGMFVIGKRKCGVGRFHSKEHVYVCLERGKRKKRPAYIGPFPPLDEEISLQIVSSF